MNTPTRVVNFDDMKFKCQCCNMTRPHKSLRSVQHDISSIYNIDTGTVVLNCRYCLELPECKPRAFNREWVLEHVLNMGDKIA